jgi:hypothetical protein
MAAGIPRLLLIVAAMGLVCGLEVEEGCVPDDDTRDLELVHVVVVHRHGDRTPISRKATTYKQSPERTAFWETTVPALETVREWGELNHDETGTFLQRDPAVFPNGHLTHVGAEGMRAVGEALRRTYVTELGFLPATLPSNTSGIVRVRSTRYPRTIQSTQNLLTALYPRAARDTAGGGGAAVEITSRDKDADAMTGPSEKRCPRLAELGWKSGAGEALPPEIRAIADKTQVRRRPPRGAARGARDAQSLGCVGRGGSAALGPLPPWRGHLSPCALPGRRVGPEAGPVSRRETPRARADGAEGACKGRGGAALPAAAAG